MVRSYFPGDGDGWKRWGARAVLFLALTVVTWPVADIVAGPSLDPSWMLGLELAHLEGVDWGSDLIFTYGPLGIGAHPVAISSGTLLASLLLAFAMQLLVVAVLYVAFRRQYGPMGSILLTYLVAGAVGSLQSDSLLVSAFGISVLALTVPRRSAQHAAWALAVGGGALAAFSVLVKLNTGAAVAAIVAAALLAAPSPKRTLALGAGSGLVTLVALWLIAKQPLPALGDYLRNAIESRRRLRGIDGPRMRRGRPGSGSCWSCWGRRSSSRRLPGPRSPTSAGAGWGRWSPGSCWFTTRS